MCGVLLEYGASNLTDSQGSTCLMHASYEGKLDICAQLIQSFPRDVNMKNDIGRSALMYAAQQGHVDVCRELIVKGVV